MKKKTLILCLLCLCLAVGTAFGDAAAAVQELSHRIYEANRLETLLGNHQSVAFMLNGESEETAEYYVYETREGACAVWGGKDMLYARGEAVYGMDGEGNMFFSPNIEENPDPLLFCGFSLVPDSEETWMDAEHDHFVAWTLEKGFYHYRTRYDKETSREWIEANTGLEWDGQTVMTEAIADAETTEMVKFIYYLEVDKEKTEIMAWNILYDVPEPPTAATLRATFEHFGEGEMTLTFIVDPGSAKERTRTLTVPTDSRLEFYGAPAVFDDAEATVPASFDGMQDHTFYVFTEPEQGAGEETQPISVVENGN